MSPNRAIRVLGFLSAAIQDDELHHLGKFSKTVPRLEAAHVVFPDEIKQFRFRLALAERFDRFNGVGRCRTLEFHRIESKTRLAFDRGAQHFQTNIGWCELLLQFVRRRGGRDKDNFFEVEGFERIPRQNQVSVMDRIEGATENADFF